MAQIVLRYLHDFRSDYALPYLTQLVLKPHIWLLFCPLPLVVAAEVLSWRRELSTESVFIFAGTIAVATALILCSVAIAAVLPVIPIK
jgi:hypothetical protein